MQDWNRAEEMRRLQQESIRRWNEARALYEARLKIENLMPKTHQVSPGGAAASGGVGFGGFAINGPISGATVEVEGKTTKTSADGSFKFGFIPDPKSVITVTGGIDTISGLPFEGEIKGFASDEVVSPYSTLYTNFIEAGGTAEDFSTFTEVTLPKSLGFTRPLLFDGDFNKNYIKEAGDGDGNSAYLIGLISLIDIYVDSTVNWLQEYLKADTELGSKLSSKELGSDAYKVVLEAITSGKTSLSVRNVLEGVVKKLELEGRVGSTKVWKDPDTDELIRLHSDKIDTTVLNSKKAVTVGDGVDPLYTASAFRSINKLIKTNVVSKEKIAQIKALDASKGATAINDELETITKASTINELEINKTISELGKISSTRENPTTSAPATLTTIASSANLKKSIKLFVSTDNKELSLPTPVNKIDPVLYYVYGKLTTGSRIYYSPDNGKKIISLADWIATLRPPEDVLLNLVIEDTSFTNDIKLKETYLLNLQGYVKQITVEKIEKPKLPTGYPEILVVDLIETGSTGDWTSRGLGNVFGNTGIETFETLKWDPNLSTNSIPVWSSIGGNETYVYSNLEKSKELFLTNSISSGGRVPINFYEVGFSLTSILDGTPALFNFGEKVISMTATIKTLEKSPTFKKSDYGNEVDTFSAGLAITRANNRGIYNSVSEVEYDNVSYISPLSTKWIGVIDWNLSFDEVVGKIDQLSTWNDSNGGYPPAAVGRRFIMVDTSGGKAAEKVWKIMFTDWTPGGAGGGFSWYREEIKK